MPAGSGSGNGAPPPLDTGVCAISPSDLVGFTGNALNRIEELEQRVAELEAKLVEASQLSDLSQQVGWVGGITYMGVSGWTQTQAGTLIPPPGWSLVDAGILPPTISSGTGLQLINIDALGNLVPTGGPVAILYTGVIQSQTPGNFTTTATLLTQYDPSGLVTNNGTSFTLNTSGFYRLGIVCGIGVITPTLLSSACLQWAISSNSSSYGPGESNGPTIRTNIAAAGSTGYNAARAMYVSSTASHVLTAIGTGAASEFIFGAATLFIQQIGIPAT